MVEKLSWSQPKIQSIVEYIYQVERTLAKHGFEVRSIQSKGPAGYPNSATKVNLILFNPQYSEEERGYSKEELPLVKEQLRKILKEEGFEGIKVTNTSYGSILVVVPFYRRYKEGD